jgi:hypothetical protein
MDVEHMGNITGEAIIEPGDMLTITLYLEGSSTSVLVVENRTDFEWIVALEGVEESMALRGFEG